MLELHPPPSAPCMTKRCCLRRCLSAFRALLRRHMLHKVCIFATFASRIGIQVFWHNALTCACAHLLSAQHAPSGPDQPDRPRRRGADLQGLCVRHLRLAHEDPVHRVLQRSEEQLAHLDRAPARQGPLL